MTEWVSLSLFPPLHVLFQFLCNLQQYCSSAYNKLVISKKNSWTIIGRSCHTYQNTSFVATKVCLPWQILSWQKYVCHDKTCRDNMFVVRKVLSWQAYFCRDRRRVLSRQKWYLVADPANDNKHHHSTSPPVLLELKKWFHSNSHIKWTPHC